MTLKTLKNNIKYCVLAHKIHQERKKLNNVREQLLVANNTIHNGRMEVDEVLIPQKIETNKKVYKLKREIIKKGLQK